MWLYSIPTWILGLLIVGITTVAGVGGFWILHKILRAPRTDDVGNVAISFVSVVCAFHSLLLAFSAVLVWQDFQDSQKAVAVEADTLGDVYRDLRLYGGPAAAEAGATLLQYAKSVVEDEWPRMADGNASPVSAQLIEKVFQQAGSLDPQTVREQIIFAEVFRHLNELMNNRRDRLQDAQSEMPGLFWMIVLIATALLIAYTGFLPNTRANVIMITGMAISIGLIFFFIVVLDHPFAGESAVTPDPLVDLLTSFDARISGSP